MKKWAFIERSQWFEKYACIGCGDVRTIITHDGSNLTGRSIRDLKVCPKCKETMEMVEENA